MENDLPIQVLNFWQEGALKKALLGQPIGTLINNGK
jgi:uridylate kinase